MIFWCRAKGILTTLRRKIALLETLSKDIIAKPKLTQRLLTWLNSLFIFISSIMLYLFSNAKSYAKSKLCRHKTDKIDAQLIAEYCDKYNPNLWQPLPSEIKELSELSRCIDSLQIEYN